MRDSCNRIPMFQLRARDHQARSDLLQVPDPGREVLGSLLSFRKHRQAGELDRQTDPRLTSFALSSRVTELALSVEHLQNQNTEKDQVNRTLADKLEAMVS